MAFCSPVFSVYLEYFKQMSRIFSEIFLFCWQEAVGRAVEGTGMNVYVQHWADFSGFKTSLTACILIAE